MEKRDGHLPRARKSWPHKVATDSLFSLSRQQIEDWVAGLSAAAQRKIIPNLLSKIHFWHAYHELAVGRFLIELGLETDFEKKFGEQTPDWFASFKDDSQSFVVEVFTANLPASTVSKNKQMAELARRLGAIPLDFTLQISCDGDSAISRLNSRRSKQIIQAVRTWLQHYNQLSEPRYSVDGFTFTVLNHDRGFPTVEYGEPVESAYFAWAPLKEGIRKKLHKYKGLALANKIPLVIAVAPGLDTDYSDFEMKNILFGGAFEGSQTSNGLFAKQPLLSGALFVCRVDMARWKIHSYVNPNATFPLPKSIFGGKPVEF